MLRNTSAGSELVLFISAVALLAISSVEHLSLTFQRYGVCVCVCVYIVNIVGTFYVGWSCWQPHGYNIHLAGLYVP